MSFIFVVSLLFFCTRSIESALTDQEDRLFEDNPYLPTLPNAPRFDINGLAIVPGTYWCGNGNISQTEDDLGLIKKTDMCCKEHDMCPDGISAGKYKHGLHNNGYYTRSHCDCDNKFYRCLKDAGNPLSIATGNTYFTLLGPKCFKKEHPIVECTKKNFLHTRCLEYKLDASEPPVYQWFDNPTF